MYGDSDYSPRTDPRAGEAMKVTFSAPLSQDSRGRERSETSQIMDLTEVLRSHNSQRREPTFQETKTFTINGCAAEKGIEFFSTLVQFLPVYMTLSDTVTVSE